MSDASALNAASSMATTGTPTEPENVPRAGAVSGAHPEDLPGSWPRPRRVWLLGGVLAWVLPGLGHAVLGQRARALRIAVGVLGLLAFGVFVGGVGAGTSDRGWWVGGQAFAGPLVGVLDAVCSGVIVGDGPRVGPTGDEALRSVGRAAELGRLSVLLAGLVNLVAIIDAAFPLIRTRRSEAHAAQEVPEPASKADAAGRLSGGRTS